MFPLVLAQSKTLYNKQEKKYIIHQFEYIFKIKFNFTFYFVNYHKRKLSILVYNFYIVINIKKL